jgi:hypothetical protein
MVAAPATPNPVTLIKSLRFIGYFLLVVVIVSVSLLGEALEPAWNIRFRISMPNWPANEKKPGLLAKAGLVSTT